MTEPSNIVFLSAGNGTVVDANIVLSHLPRVSRADGSSANGDNGNREEI